MSIYVLADAPYYVDGDLQPCSDPQQSARALATLLERPEIMHQTQLVQDEMSIDLPALISSIIGQGLAGGNAGAKWQSSCCDLQLQMCSAFHYLFRYASRDVPAVKHQLP